MHDVCINTKARMFQLPFSILQSKFCLTVLLGIEIMLIVAYTVYVHLPFIKADCVMSEDFACTN